MKDYHVHIGQWHEIYYEPKAIIQALSESTTKEFWFSSTTSERYCKESIKVQNNNDLKESLPSAKELYGIIHTEVSDALDMAKKLQVKAHPLYWAIPELHFTNVTNIEKAMNDLPYEGFKIHPRGNIWDLSDKKTIELTNEIFSYAEKHKLFILIHCGPDSFELPRKFEEFIRLFPNVTVQLAHCRPLEDTLYLLKNYKNTVCDTAFVSKEVQKAIIEAGFESRIRFGTDFPITHYFSERPDHNPSVQELIEYIKNN